MAEAVQRARQHSDAIGEQRTVRWVVDVRLDHRGVHPQAPPADDPAVLPEMHESCEHVLEHGVVEQVRQAHQRLGIGHALAINPTELAID
jgi:hypothetical protein